jgi:hypothetical protein
MNQTLNTETLMQFCPFIVMLIAPVILMIIVALKRNIYNMGLFACNLPVV